MVLVALRLPLTRKYLNANVPADVRSEIGDDRLLSLSMTVGTVMFFLLYAVIIALYFSLAAFLDKRVIPGKSVIAGRVNIGAFFVIAIFATIPVNLFSVLFGVIQPRDVPDIWAYFPSMALVALAHLLPALARVFHRQEDPRCALSHRSVNNSCHRLTFFNYLPRTEILNEYSALQPSSTNRGPHGRCILRHFPRPRLGFSFPGRPQQYRSARREERGSRHTSRPSEWRHP